MDFQLLWTGLVLVGMILALMFGWGTTDFFMLASLAGLFLFGVISPKGALTGFSNEGMITVALLFVLSKAIRNPGALNRIVYRYLSNEKNAPHSGLCSR